jgi:hypothetical protein
MPLIIIQANVSGHESPHVTFSERVAAANLESLHYRTQLIERLSWATADAEALESDVAAGAGNSPIASRRSARDRPPTRRAGHARQLLTALALVIVAALSLTPVALARPGRGHTSSHHQPADHETTEIALRWYDITDQTIAAAAYPEPVTQSRAWSVSWLAAARAVDRSRDARYTVAAFAQALHDALVAQVPTQQAGLDADLAATLGQIPDGHAKNAGVAAARHQAQVVLAERHGDGLDTASVDIPFSPPAPGPGVWQPTPPTFAPAIRAGEGNARPFLLAAGDQFDPGPPPSLTSKTYLADLAEVRDYGSATSAFRTPEQTDVALFWEPAINVQYVQVLRAALADTHRSLAWDTRFVVAFNVVTTDAQIAIYNAKFEYLFWRPVTAIQTGPTDPDPGWTPLFATPRYPDWPSGHGGVAGAAQQVLTAFLGPFAPAPIEVTSPTDPGSTHTYRTWAQITREVIDARVWEGIHFRFSDTTGARLGDRVATYDLRHLRSIGL